VEGRSSFDAVIVAAVLGGLDRRRWAPFDLSGKTRPPGRVAFDRGRDRPAAGAAPPILKGKLLLG